MKDLFYTALVLFLWVGCSQTQSPSRTLDLAHEEQEAISITPDTDVSPEENILLARDDDQTAPIVERTEEKVWTSLFNGESLAGWAVPVYGGDGAVDVQEGNLVIGRGEQMTGIRYEKEFPRMDYEIRYEARRTEGYDFFAACTFPVKESFCTFINGGWGGGAVGLSSINGYDASENETSSYFDFREKTWYRFRINVKENRIQVWITPQNKEGDWEAEEGLIDFEMDDDTRLSTRMEVDLYKPFGFCTWASEGQLRNIEYQTDTNGRNE